MKGETFHIGRTAYSFRVKSKKNADAITYNLFIGDSFSDPNFILEKKGSTNPKYQADHLGPNLEFGGVPFNYKTRVRTYFMPPLFPRLH